MSEMYTRIRLITPEDAEKLLQTNPRNRSIKTDKVLRLIDDIRNGHWMLTHQGIAIDKNGKLIDGHHRLTAIASTGIPCEMMVTYNAVESEKIDSGTPRNDRDSLYMAGVIDKESIEYNISTYPLVVYMVSRSLGERRSRCISMTHKHNVYQKYRPWIDPIIGITKKLHRGKTRSAAVMYAMCCAYKAGVSIDILDKWFHIVSSGDFYVPGNDFETRVSRSLLLYTSYLNNKAQGKSQADKDETLRRAMSSIQHYAANEVITKLYGMLCYPEITVSEDDLFGNT